MDGRHTDPSIQYKKSHKTDLGGFSVFCVQRDTAHAANLPQNRRAFRKLTNLRGKSKVTLHSYCIIAPPTISDCLKLKRSRMAARQVCNLNRRFFGLNLDPARWRRKGADYADRLVARPLPSMIGGKEQRMNNVTELHSAASNRALSSYQPRPLFASLTRSAGVLWRRTRLFVEIMGWIGLAGALAAAIA